MKGGKGKTIQTQFNEKTFFDRFTYYMRKNDEIELLHSKFFYVDNRLHYRILIHKGDNETIFGEFDTYFAYVQAYDRLQKNLIEKTKKNISLAFESEMQKMA